MRRRLVAWLVPPDLTLARWKRTCVGYALAAGGLAGGVDLLLDLDVSHWHPALLVIPLTICLIGAVSVMAAFLLARAVSLSLGARMADFVDRSVSAGDFPAWDSGGWPVFEQLSRSLYRLLAPREQRIAALQQEADYYRRLAEGMLGLELEFEPDRRLRWVNPALESMVGYSRSECMTMADPFEHWVYYKDRAPLRTLIERVQQGQAQDDIELRVCHKDGRTYWCSCRAYLLRDEVGEVCGLRVSMQDIQPRKDADLKLLETVAALRRAQALKEHYLGRSNDEKMRLAALLEIVNLGILFVDRDHRVVYVNQMFASMWQLGDRDNVVGMRDDALLEATARCRVDDAAYVEHVENVVVRRSKDVCYEIACVGGQVIRERSSIVPAADGSSQPIGRVWLYEDITESLRTEGRLTELAERDPLTNLYNLRRFREELNRQLAESERHETHLGLVVFELDGIRPIVEQYGHKAGDEALHSVIRVISNAVRRNEILFRLGGDEFAVLTFQPAADSLSYLASRIVSKAASLVFTFGGAETHVIISLGVATTEVSGYDAEALVAAADRAMYQAKTEGRNRWVMAIRQ